MNAPDYHSEQILEFGDALSDLPAVLISLAGKRSRKTGESFVYALDALIEAKKLFVFCHGFNHALCAFVDQPTATWQAAAKLVVFSKVETFANIACGKRFVDEWLSISVAEIYARILHDSYAPQKLFRMMGETFDVDSSCVEIIQATQKKFACANGVDGRVFGKPLCQTAGNKRHGDWCQVGPLSSRLTRATARPAIRVCASCEML